MEKLFTETQKSYATDIPSKRLNLKRVASRGDKQFKRKDKAIFVKKKITIILDLSGSMHLSIDNMRLILDVLNKMALKNLIEATLILTAIKSCRPCFNIISMPFKNNELDRLDARYAGEGLESTMKKNINLLSQSDYVWILTDGMIDEKPLYKKDFHKHGIKTHAMYIGDISYKKEMQNSFDFVICEKDVQGLTKEIFTLVK